MSTPNEEIVSEDTINLQEEEGTVKEEVSGGSEETSNEVDTPSTSKQDEWAMPGRYRTQAEMAAALQYFEAENSRRANELHRLRQEQAKASQSEDRTTVNKRFAAEVEKDPVAAIEKVAETAAERARQEAQELRMEMTYNRFMENEEFRSLEPEMARIAQEFDDVISPDMRNNPKLLTALFMMAKGAKSKDLLAQAAAAGKSSGERLASRKAKASVEGNSGSKGHSKAKFEDLSLEEMEKRLAEGDI
jgi:hypothetical protein